MSLWLPVATLWRREMIRFWREKGRLFAFVGTPLLLWVFLGSGFGNLRGFFPGSVILTVMFSAVFSCMSLIEDRREGFLLSVLVSPAPRSSIVLGKLSGIATLAWIQGLIFLLFGPLAGIRPGLGEALGAAALLFVISLMFAALGFALAWKMDSTQAFHGIVNLVLFPLWMLSGAMFPMSGAHGWIRALMQANPLTYSTAALARLLDPASAAGPGLGFSAGLTLACCAALLAVAVGVVRQRRTRSLA